MLKEALHIVTAALKRVNVGITLFGLPVAIQSVLRHNMP